MDDRRPGCGVSLRNWTPSPPLKGSKFHANFHARILVSSCPPPDGPTSRYREVGGRRTTTTLTFAGTRQGLYNG